MINERIVLTDQSKVPSSERHGELIIHKFPFRIGRHQMPDEVPLRFELSENDLSVTEAKRPFHASRSHVEIGFSGGAVYVRDLGSASGTLVNGLKMGGGHGESATFILEKTDNIIQLGQKGSPWIFQLTVPQPKDRFRLLIADDDPDICLICRGIFADEYDILEADNGESALQIALKERPDVILLDWEMPILNGVDACKYIKTNLKTSNIPVVMLTGKAKIVDRIMGIEAGADDYVTKPPNFDDLKTRVNAALARSLRARDVHWLTGIASEAAFRKEVNEFLEHKTTKNEFELIAVTLQELGAMQTQHGARMADAVVANVAEALWAQSLKAERTVAGQLRLGQWGILTPAANRRFVEKSVKSALDKVLTGTPVKYKIKSYSAGRCANYYDFSGMM